MTTRIPEGEAPPPGSPEWRRLITASKVPAILGYSPWASPFEVFYQMTGEYVIQQPESDTFRWGHHMEDTLVRWWQLHNPGWEVADVGPGGSREVAYRNEALPFPHLATLDAVATCEGEQRILECKTSGSMTTFAGGVPLHYQLQVQFQMLVSGIHRATVVAHTVGPAKFFEMEFDPRLGEAMARMLSAWMGAVRRGVPPAITHRPQDGVVQRYLNGPVVDEVVEVPAEIREAWDSAREARRAAEEAESLAKNRLLQAMGSARVATVGGEKLATITANGQIRHA